MRLTSSETEPDREPLRVYYNINLGCEPAPRSAETVISIPFSCRRGLPMRTNGSASIIWMLP